MPDAMFNASPARETAATSAPQISARGLTRVFGSGGQAVTAVRGVDLDILSGEFLAVLGRSGSGKTTLLNLLAGLDRPTAGQVLFGGRNLSAFSETELVALRRGKIGFIFQSFGLLPLLSAEENVELPLHIRGTPRRERRRQVLEALGLVGLGARARHRPYELSGGEQQRVSIARALVISPEVLFADEPTGELDTLTGMTIATLLRDIARERGVTVVVATHDLALAELSSRQVELADGAFKP
jgi:putative ABC transport system ATP-binding protein